MSRRDAIRFIVCFIFAIGLSTLVFSSMVMLSTAFRDREDPEFAPNQGTVQEYCIRRANNDTTNSS